MRRVTPHDSLVVVISDLAGMDEETSRHFVQLAQHNDAMVCLVRDPMETAVPGAGRFVVGDGELQVEVDAGDPSFRARFDAEFGGDEQRIREELARLEMPVIPLSTDQEVLAQVQRALGFAARGGAAR